MNLSLSVLVTFFALKMILDFSYILTALMSSAVLQAVPPTADNIIVYLFMAVIYLLLSVLIGIRDILIIVFAAGGMVILTALYLIPSLQHTVKTIFVYFLGIIFMQPILVFVAGIGVMFMKEIPIELIPLQSSLYSALMLILLLIGIFFIFGFGWISRLIGTVEAL